MKNIFRQFVGPGINLEDNLFRKALIKITLLYAVSIIILVTAFSGGLYVFFVKNLDVDIEYKGDQGILFEQELFDFEYVYDDTDTEEESELEGVLIEKLETRLIKILITIDLLVSILSFFIGYFLAKKTLDPIQKSVLKQKAFVSDVSHELRTPLSVIKTALETSNIPTENMLENYKIINKDILEETNRLVRLCNDLLFLARHDQNIPSARTKINFSKICVKKLKLFNSYAKEKGIIIKSAIQPDIYLRGHHEQLEQLIFNLLKNAIDYSKKNGKVSFRLIEDNKFINFIVEDHGIGMDKKTSEKIFERFYKADKARKTEKDQGAGLGLSIVKEIVKTHKAKIEVLSLLNKGTKIIVYFPK